MHHHHHHAVQFFQILGSNCGVPEFFDDRELGRGVVRGSEPLGAAGEPHGAVACAAGCESFAGGRDRLLESGVDACHATGTLVLRFMNGDVSTDGSGDRTLFFALAHVRRCRGRDPPKRQTASRECMHVLGIARTF